MPELQLAQNFVAEPTARWGQFIPLIDLSPMLENAIGRLRAISSFLRTGMDMEASESQRTRNSL